MIQCRAVAAAVSIVAAVGVLVGCDDSSADDPADSGLPSESETTKSSPPPNQPTGPMPPPLPAEAEGTSPKAANAFVRHYVDLINYAKRTLDVAPWQDASGSGCVDCHKAIQALVDLKSAGSRIHGGQGHVTSIDHIPGQPSNEPILDVAVRWSKERIDSATGGHPQINDAVTCLHTWSLRHMQSAGWTLVRWRTVECHA